jgi:hypothetical protein
MEVIEKQQAAATEIIKIAAEAGLIVILWTAEDVAEKVEAELAKRGIAQTKEQIIDIACDVMDENENGIEEESISLGSDILVDAIGEYLDEHLS